MTARRTEQTIITRRGARGRVDVRETIGDVLDVVELPIDDEAIGEILAVGRWQIAPNTILWSVFALRHGRTGHRWYMLATLPEHVTEAQQRAALAYLRAATEPQP